MALVLPSDGFHIYLKIALSSSNQQSGPYPQALVKKRVILLQVNMLNFPRFKEMKDH